jgi:hypothetical protein
MVCYKLMKKVTKNDPKMTRYKMLKKWSKIDLPWGVQNDEKSINFDVGDPGPQKRNFLKFCSFLQKLPPFRPPKSTPINGPIGKPIPHK